MLLNAQNYGNIVKIKHVLTNTHLHSHAINYGHPSSSGQQQVTAFEGADDNDYWMIKPEHGNNTRTGAIQHGAIIRLEHQLTRRNLHSHAGIPSPVSGQQEVTCFGDNGNGDSNDNWRIEIEGGGTWAVNRRIRLIHVNTNHALHSHAGWSHPDWTAGQQEVTGFGGRDDNDWWVMTEIKLNRVIFPTDFVLQIPTPEINFTITPYQNEAHLLVEVTNAVANRPVTIRVSNLPNISEKIVTINANAEGKARFNFEYRSLASYCALTPEQRRTTGKLDVATPNNLIERNFPIYQFYATPIGGCR
jgi:hypothetical protein